MQDIDTLTTIAVFAPILPYAINFFIDNFDLGLSKPQKAFIVCLFFSFAVIIIEGLVTVPEYVRQFTYGGMISFYIATITYRKYIKEEN